MIAPGRRKQIRAYADASVFGGVFDEEFREESCRFFDLVRSGRFALVVSNAVEREVAPAPAEVVRFYRDMLSLSEVVEIGRDALQLQEAYLTARVVTRNWEDDALHVAIATVSGCDMIVSWNFTHIVHFQKMPLYNAIKPVVGLPIDRHLLAQPGDL